MSDEQEGADMVAENVRPFESVERREYGGHQLEMPEWDKNDFDSVMAWIKAARDYMNSTRGGGLLTQKQFGELVGLTNDQVRQRFARGVELATWPNTDRTRGRALRESEAARFVCDVCNYGAPAGMRIGSITRHQQDTGHQLMREV